MKRISYTLSREYIPRGVQWIFTVVIHQRKSHLRQFACARTTDGYDFEITVPGIRVMLQTELWLCHNTKSENTVFGENGEMSDR